MLSASRAASSVSRPSAPARGGAVACRAQAPVRGLAERASLAAATVALSAGACTRARTPLPPLPWRARVRRSLPLLLSPPFPSFTCVACMRACVFADGNIGAARSGDLRVCLSKTAYIRLDGCARVAAPFVPAAAAASPVA
eukprot:349615-Chlamydomonas_euryale.AAC.10